MSQTVASSFSGCDKSAAGPMSSVTTRLWVWMHSHGNFVLGGCVCEGWGCDGPGKVIFSRCLFPCICGCSWACEPGTAPCISEERTQ